MTRLAVEYAELSALASGLRWQAGEVDDHARMLTGAAASGDIAQAVLIAPAEAAAAEGALLQAAARADLLLVELEARALAADTAAQLYHQADEVLEAGIDAADAARDWTNAEIQEWEREWASFYDETYPFLLDEAIHTLIVDGQDLAFTVFPDDELAALTGGHWPTTSHEEAAAGLLALLDHMGIESDPDLTHDAKPHATGYPPPGGSTVDLRDLMNFEVTAYNDHHPQVVITTIEGEPPRYIVNIPGTDPKHLLGPTGILGDLNTMADATMEGERSQLVQETLEIMREQIPKGAEVMLSGHSLGGMAAASIASDPNVGKDFTIKAIATQGSPIAHYAIPPDVSVLSFEHTQDPIPQLDGADNPDRTSPAGTPDNWVTVSDDAPTNSPVPPHASRLYNDTMKAHEDDPEVQAWLNQNAGFFGTASAQQASAIYNR